MSTNGGASFGIVQTRLGAARKFVMFFLFGSVRMNSPLAIDPLRPVSAIANSKENVARYQRASLGRARWQMINSFAPYAALWFAMDRALAVSYWLMLPFALLAAGFLVRIFIIFHDCSHGSFFKSKNANHVVGVIAGLLNMTPYRHWRWQHASHHGTSSDLDRRGIGDIWMLTVEEYLHSTRSRRLAYRFVRNPIVLFLIAPVFVFVLQQRFASPTAPPRERQAVWKTNLGLCALALLMSALIGLKAFVLIQLTVSALAGSIGLWLFYVQHQFEGAYWVRSDRWRHLDSAIYGSSFYKLPKILQWFTGNIGFHHIHHLNPRVPNYYLQRCHEADSLCNAIVPVTLLASFKSLSFRLWDEKRQVFVGFRHVGMA
jgi:acyl-lipid omega-6 desaturase (Delta-12 desaturase)